MITFDCFTDIQKKFTRSKKELLLVVEWRGARHDVDFEARGPCQRKEP